MFPELFNILLDREGRQVNEWAMGRGVKLRDNNGGGWKIKQVLYPDDIVLASRNKRASPVYCELI